MSNFTTNRGFALLLMAMALGGCSWFSWIPGIGDESKADETKPAKLEPFDAEVRVSVEWQRKVGDGLGEKIHTAGAGRGC